MIKVYGSKIRLGDLKELTLNTMQSNWNPEQMKFVHQGTKMLNEFFFNDISKKELLGIGKPYDPKVSDINDMYIFVSDIFTDSYSSITNPMDIHEILISRYTIDNHLKKEPDTDESKLPYSKVIRWYDDLNPFEKDQLVEFNNEYHRRFMKGFLDLLELDFDSDNNYSFKLKKDKFTKFIKVLDKISNRKLPLKQEQQEIDDVVEFDHEYAQFWNNVKWNQNEEGRMKTEATAKGLIEFINKFVTDWDNTMMPLERSEDLMNARDHIDYLNNKEYNSDKRSAAEYQKYLKYREDKIKSR